MTSVSCAAVQPYNSYGSNGRGASIGTGVSVENKKEYLTLRDLAEELKRSSKGSVPQDYMVKEEERPSIKHDEFDELPVIDLALVDKDRGELARQLGEAAREWGFFQIVNHGLSVDDLDEIQAQGMKFFELPAEIKLKLGMQGYFGDNTKVKRSSLHWAEGWMLRYHPDNQVEEKIRVIFPEGNDKLRDALNKFCSATEALNELILELLAEHLGLGTKFFSRHLNSQRSVALRLNYYPACPQPLSVLGANGHTDGSSLTFLLQDKVGGLQTHRDGQWFGVRPIEGALVINVGDALHAWSNGLFKSVLHRVVVNAEVDRLSFAAFMNVDNSLALSAPDELVDEDHPRLYKPFTFADYVQQVLRARAEEKDNSNTMMDGNRLLAGLRYDSQSKGED
ncbi:hypothetical protein R1sor_003131 [Riccia sorocarpa]|uniref:Fe2OG dioxygenase domain-containing protein n=1 Tax=Riccia sorocarpa TaxID=122646 RepID=A0ABD3H3I1_9MARC